jgi:hypothetical protein
MANVEKENVGSSSRFPPFPPPSLSHLVLSCARPTASHGRLQGNEQFKQGKFSAAVECYTRGLTAQPDHAVLLCNRSMAYIKLRK